MLELGSNGKSEDHFSSSPSKTFALFASVFCVGILMGPVTLAMTTSVSMFLLSVSLLTGVFAPQKTRTRLFAFAFFFCVLGIFRYGQSEIPPGIPTVRDVAGSVVRMDGIVANEPTQGEKTQQVTLRSVHVVEKPVFGKILVSVPFSQPVAYGDKLIFACALQKPRPFNGFAYDRYLQAKGVLAICRSPREMERVPASGYSVIGSILSVKQHIIQTMRQIFPEPHASFLFGLVFGGSSGMEKELEEAFTKTGMSHILAASGFNVSLFTFVFFGWIISYVGRKKGAIATVGLLFVYVVIAGATAAVLRAALFGVMTLVGMVVGRKGSTLNLLLCTAAILLFANPRWLMDDVGFQLSFVAFVAILYVAPRVESQLTFLPERFGMRDSLAGSLAAIVLTLPIVLWQFGSVSLVAPFANFFVLPLLPLMLFYVLVLLPVAWVFLPLAKFLALPLYAGSVYVLEIISLFASLDFASVPVPFSRAIAVITAICLVLLSVAYFRKP